MFNFFFIIILKTTVKSKKITSRNHTPIYENIRNTYMSFAE